VKMRFVSQTLVLTCLITSIGVAQESAGRQLAHFDHVHLNVTDPAAAIEFYTSKFDSEKAKFGMSDAVWAQK